jgi:hypothetical protein
MQATEPASIPYGMIKFVLTKFYHRAGNKSEIHTHNRNGYNIERSAQSVTDKCKTGATSGYGMDRRLAVPVPVSVQADTAPPPL